MSPGLQLLRIPQCMTLITPELVEAAIERYIAALTERISPSSARESSFARGSISMKSRVSR